MRDSIKEFIKNLCNVSWKHYQIKEIKIFYKRSQTSY